MKTLRKKGQLSRKLARTMSLRYSDFNAPRFFYVSQRLAKQFNHLKVSKIIMHYYSVYRRHSYLMSDEVEEKMKSEAQRERESTFNDKDSKDKQEVESDRVLWQEQYKPLSLYLLTLFTTSLSPQIQDFILYILFSLLAFILCCIHILLWQEHPAYVLAPTILIGFLLHFCINWSIYIERMNAAQIRPLSTTSTTTSTNNYNNNNDNNNNNNKNRSRARERDNKE
jgi:hypothetical protein